VYVREGMRESNREVEERSAAYILHIAERLVPLQVVELPRFSLHFGSASP
jgi:hypothetical protein